MKKRTVKLGYNEQFVTTGFGITGKHFIKRISTVLIQHYIGTDMQIKKECYLIKTYEA